MGYHSLIENVVLPQVASSGFATIQLPPEQPEPPSTQHIALLLLALAVFIALVWLLWPCKFCKKPRNP